MKIEGLIGKKIKISARTLTMLNDEGKTVGMVTGIDTFYNMSFRDKCTYNKRARESGVGNWSRLFLINDIWYFITDDAAVARAKEWESFDGPVPRERLEQMEKAAIAFGAIVIHVERATDNRKD